MQSGSQQAFGFPDWSAITDATALPCSWRTVNCQSSSSSRAFCLSLNPPVITWILKGAIDGVPLELEEAALVDGCSRLDIVLSIVGRLEL